MSWVVRVALLAVFALPLDTSAAQPVVIQEGDPGRPRVVVSVETKTNHRSIQLTSQRTPTYPTVDVTCDGKRRAITLTRSELAGKSVLGIYEVPETTAKSMLGALECRLLLPDQQINLPAQLLRAAWAIAPKDASARAGIHPLDGWRCPRAQPIKGNFTTYSGEPCIYHVPGGQLYVKTKPETCYATEADARQDGCRRSKR